MPDIAGVNGLRTNFRIIGTPNLPGSLSSALATGVAKFGSDYVMPGMLHARFLRSPYANAKVLSVDCTKAWAIPGVVDIVTWEDNELRDMVTHGEVRGSPRPLLDNLADREGSEVAVIVVAEDEDICEDAIRALVVEWEVCPHVVDIQYGRSKDAPVIRPNENFQPMHSSRQTDKDPPPKKGNVYFASLTAGDIEAGFSEADYIAEYTVYTPSFAATMPNPHGSVAWWSKDPYQSDGDNLHIEGAVREKYAICETYNIPERKTIQEGLFMGGKYCDWGLRKSQEITPLLAKRTGRPVRCVNTREETFDFMMNERYMYMKIGFKKDGTITAVDDLSVVDNGTRGNSGFATIGALGGRIFNTWRCKNVRSQMEMVDTNRGMMYISGQHSPFNWDAGTVALHVIAEKLEMDPIDVARLNLHGPESQDDPNPVPSFDMCVDAGKKMMNWHWHKSGARTLPDGRMHGMSFRYQLSPRHSGAFYKCKLEFRDGEVHMPTQGPLFGAYVVECNAMVVAEELGIEYDEVIIDFDHREPFRAFGGGSDGTTASAWVMKECANKLKQQILEAAIRFAENPPPQTRMFQGPPATPGPFIGLTPDELDIVGSRVVIKADPNQGTPLSLATEENLFATFTGRPPLSVYTVGGGGKILDVMNTAYCEVAVDTDTGEVEILRFCTAVDPGLVLRPTSLESQIDQVMFFSQGCQLLEDFVYDSRTGVMLNNNFIDYKKLGLLDAAPVEHEFIESRGSDGAYGSSGISHSMANTHLVVIAIQNAIGAWVDPPATPDKVLKALGKL